MAFPHVGDQIDIELYLIEEIQIARAAFDSSTVEFNRIMAHFKEPGTKLKNETCYFHQTKGPVTVEDSLRIHQNAIVGYRQALQNLNKFLISG